MMITQLPEAALQLVSTYLRMLRACFVICGIAVLSGCTTVVTETAKKAFEDRSSENQATDIRMATSYFNTLLEKDKNLALDVSLDVWEQRVLITGALTDARQRQEVEALVRADRRARQVHNEILLVSKDAQNQRRDAARNKATPKRGSAKASTTSGSRPRFPPSCSPHRVSLL